jgi:hypothetical protein
MTPNAKQPESVREEHQSLWLLTISPALWATHFMVSYIAGALWCGRTAEGLNSPFPMQAAIASFGAIALAGIVVVGLKGWRMHTYGGASEPPHDRDTPEDRHRFLGLSTVLLSALSALATVYVALSALLVRSCG